MGSATTKEAVRRAIQHSQESLRTLAGRYGINPKTVAKWKARASVSDAQMGSKELSSTLIIVPDGALESLPLAVLITSKSVDAGGKAVDYKSLAQAHSSQ